jgi:hypothetical protein
MDASRFQELQTREIEHVQRGDELLRVACAVILKGEDPPLADRKELVLRLLQQYDATTKDAPTVLDEQTLQFIHWALEYLRKRRLFLGQFRPVLQNPWLVFHLDNFFERDVTVPSDLSIPWSDNPAIHSIVEARLELCEELAVVQPDYRLMSLFLQSTSFSICSRTFPHLVMHLSLTIQHSAAPIIEDGDGTVASGGNRPWIRSLNRSPMYLDMSFPRFSRRNSIGDGFDHSSFPPNRKINFSMDGCEWQILSLHIGSGSHSHGEDASSKSLSNLEVPRA